MLRAAAQPVHAYELHREAQTVQVLGISVLGFGFRVWGVGIRVCRLCRRDKIVGFIVDVAVLIVTLVVFWLDS